MITRRFGRTGFEVSALGLGGLQFTGMYGVPVHTADSIIDYAVNNGINFIDTAQLYGCGESEALIGRALLRHPDKNIIVCDKVGHFKEGILALSKDPDSASQKYDEIVRTIKHSLWILRQDAFDILMLHEAERGWEIDPVTGDSVIMQVLEDVKKEGLAKNIGASSWDMKALTNLIKTGRIDAVMVAGGISLLERGIYEELIPAALEYDTGVSVGAILGQNTPGLIVADRNLTAQLKDSKDEKVVALGEKLDKLYDLAEELKLSMVQMAVRYVLSFEEIHTDSMGARELSHIKDNIQSIEMGPLPADVVSEINKIQDSALTYDYNTVSHAHITKLLEK